MHALSSIISASLALVILALATPAQSPKFEQRIAEKKFTGCGPNAAGGRERASARVVYLEVIAGVKPSTARNINGAILRRVSQPYFHEESLEFTTPQHVVENFIGEVEKACKKAEGTSWDGSASFETEVSVLWQSPELLSLRVQEYYFWGAYPNDSISYLNFSLSDGREVKLTDVIMGRHMAEFLRIAERHFRSEREKIEGTPPKGLDDWKAMFPGGKFRLPQSFGILDDALSFYYVPIPHAWGPTEITISASEIRHLLRHKHLWPVKRK